MPRPTIDYLNARREAKRSTAGGTNYARAVNPVDLRDRDSGQHPLDLAHDQVIAIFAEFRSWFAESSRRLAVGDLTEVGDYVPF